MNGWLPLTGEVYVQRRWRCGSLVSDILGDVERWWRVSPCVVLSDWPRTATPRLSALKRGDRVQTIGGMLGSVVKISDDEVVLRVDDAESESKGNTRIRFARSAIQTVLVQSTEPKDEEPKNENA